MAEQIAPGVEFLGELKPEYRDILTPEALAFITELQRRFGAEREALLAKRIERQAAISAGALPDFLPETAHIREADWTVGPIPADLQDRRVEITGPVDRKMIINALNSGAKVFMADFEDSSTPTWANLVEGQLNVRDAYRRTISLDAGGKHYRLNDTIATLMVRPRGWHLPEKHVRIDGKPMSGSLFDFGLCFFHNARTALANGSGSYFYLPKLESHLEARLWNAVFNYAQDGLGIPRGTIKATVLIETILAAFEMDEILYELRDHIVGLNCGRWDYIFSFIKKLQAHPEFFMPDRAQVTMTRHFLRSYSRLLIQTCHRRGAYALGGMAAFIPVKDDPQANATAFERVRSDKEREAGDGHDGTWVAHPGLVPVAMDVFDRYMPGPNQLDKRLEDLRVTAKDLLTVPEGNATAGGLRVNVGISLRYMEAWLRGNGCVPILGLMEDAATAEISRAQIWQWIHNPRGVLFDGRRVTAELFREELARELEAIRKELGEDAFGASKFPLAAELLDRISTSEKFEDFLTTLAYDYV